MLHDSDITQQIFDKKKHFRPKTPEFLEVNQITVLSNLLS